MSMNGVFERVDAAIAERNLLKHPFYQDWQAGMLSRERLRLYAGQYYWHVEAFPTYLRVLVKRADGDLRDIVLENLAEEEDPAAPHLKLWRDFASAVGVSEELLWTTTALPGIERLVFTYGKIVKEYPVVEAVAALYAYEAQVPEISTSKMGGLRRHYQVTSPKGLAYFAVHEEADQVHRAAWRSWLERNVPASDAAGERLLTTVRLALDALWEGLDAVQREPC